MTVHQSLQGLSQQELIAKIVAMQQAAQHKLTLKVTAQKVDEKTGKVTGTNGAISMYGLSRFPVTLYAGQWERLIGEVDHIKAFIAANAAVLSRKE